MEWNVVGNREDEGEGRRIYKGEGKKECNKQDSRSQIEKERVGIDESGEV